MISGSALTVLGLTRVVAQVPRRDAFEPESGQRVVLLDHVIGVRRHALALEEPRNL